MRGASFRGIQRAAEFFSDGAHRVGYGSDESKFEFILKPDDCDLPSTAYRAAEGGGVSRAALFVSFCITDAYNALAESVSTRIEHLCYWKPGSDGASLWITVGWRVEAERRRMLPWACVTKFGSHCSSSTSLAMRVTYCR